MPKEFKYKIGDWVYVREKTEVGYYGSEQPPIFKTAKKIPVNVQGQIVGLRRKFTGKVKSPAYSYPNEYDQNWLDVSEELILWEVKLGYFNKPILVAEEDLERYFPKEKFKVMNIGQIVETLPLLYTRKVEWTKEARESLRRDMASIPRDEKGRWLSC